MTTQTPTRPTTPTRVAAPPSPATPPLPAPSPPPPRTRGRPTPAPPWHRRRAGVVVIAILAIVAVLVPVGGAQASAGTTTVAVHFTPRGSECGVTNPHSRTVATPAVLTGALEALLAGPTAAESRHVASWFSDDTAGMLRSVAIRDGVAHVDFADLRPVIPNASTSCGSAILLSELTATATQFPAVDAARYSINGSEHTFYSWLQRPVPGDGTARRSTEWLHHQGPIRRADGAGATLRRVRIGRHRTFDRLVFEFRGGIPSYDIRFASVPRKGGSGQPIAVGGNTALQVSLGAATVDLDDPGFPRTFSPVSQTPRFPTLRTVRYGGQFEGQSVFGAGLRGRTARRVHELSGPPRLVIDVAHGARVRRLRTGIRRGVDVTDWKIRLNTVQHGAFASSARPPTRPLPTGTVFGTNARRATRVLQRAEGVRVTGVVDGATRAAMNRALRRSSFVQP